MALMNSTLQRVSLSQVVQLAAFGCVWQMVLLSPFINLNNLIQVAAVSLTVGALFVVGLRISGFFQALRIRSRRHQLVMTLGMLGLVSLAVSAIATAILDAHTSLSFLVILGMNSLLVPIGWLCMKFEWLLNLLVRRPRLLLNTSQEDKVRIGWHLARFGYRNEVELVDFDENAFCSPDAFGDIRVFVNSPSSQGLSACSMPLLAGFLSGVPVVDVEHVITALSQRIDVSRTDNSTLLRYAPRFSLRRRLYERSKLFLEPVVAAIMFLFLSPVLLAVGWAVRISGPGPILFRQVREGSFGKTFTLLKFRTMTVDAEKDGPQWSSGDGDTRVTRIGKFLRATRLDELPQLVNIMRGEMSFIGPRPERPEISKVLVESIPGFPLRNAVKPGITGWAQVRAGYAASVDQSRIKLEYDLFYALNASFPLDLEIILKTLVVGALGEKRVHAASHRLDISSELALAEASELQTAVNQ